VRRAAAASGVAPSPQPGGPDPLGSKHLHGSGSAQDRTISAQAEVSIREAEDVKTGEMRMKISVLNGSPKGDLSVTMQYVHYVHKKLSQHEFRTHNVAKDIGRILDSRETLLSLLEDVRASDGVLWAFPVYKGLVPSQYMRFIERISERDHPDAFKNKFTAALSTSARVFDHTAHNYVRAVCDDLDMQYVDYYSADYEDLTRASERARLILFAENFFHAIESRLAPARMYPPLRFSTFTYKPGRVKHKTHPRGKKIVVLTHRVNPRTNLAKMIRRFQGAVEGGVQVVDLDELHIQGGCRGCIQCWYDNQCIYRDGFQSFYNSTIVPADILITAGAVRGRYYSYKLKEFGDRLFFNHHRPCFRGKQLAEIVSGPFSQLAGIMDITPGSSEFSHANYAGCVSDECEDSAVIDAMLDGLAERLVYLSCKHYIRPTTFRGLGIHKVIRDLTWSKLRAMMPNDHRHYKENQLYDFPYKDVKAIALNVMMTPLTRIPAFRREMTKKMASMMVLPYQRIVKNK